MTALERWRSFLEGERVPLAAAAVAAFLTGSSLFGGLATEDYVFRAATRAPFSWSAVNLFGGPEVPGAVLAGKEAGVLPWLASDTLRLSFWRPLASLSHQLDYRLLGSAAWVMHLESVLLYALLAYLTARLLTRLVEPRWVGGLAALLFAVDDGHGHAVGWISNRNAVLAGVFGLLALLAHDRWRRDGWRLGAPLSALALALALGSSEMGLGALAYLGAHALFLEKRGGRLTALGPALGVTAAWALAYRELGHGARGSGIYLDPARKPLEYLAALPDRLGANLLGQLGLPPADAWSALGDESHLALASGGLLLLLVSVLVLRRELLARDRGGAALRFALAGMLFALLPVCATFPSDRTLLFASVGASVLVARVIAAAGKGAPLGARALGIGFFALHLVLAALLLPFRSLTMTGYHARAMRAANTAYGELTAGDARLVVLDAPDYYFCSLLRLLRVHAAGVSAPPSVCVAGTLDGIELSRVDDNTLEIRAAKGFLAEPFDRIYRSHREPMRPGESVYFGSAEATVTEVDARGAPLAARFRFMWPLDSDKLRFVTYASGAYRAVAPPGPGETLTLP